MNSEFAPHLPFGHSLVTGRLFCPLGALVSYAVEMEGCLL